MIGDSVVGDKTWTMYFEMERYIGNMWSKPEDRKFGFCRVPDES